jgi:hypothetical protein
LRVRLERGEALDGEVGELVVGDVRGGAEGFPQGFQIHFGISFFRGQVVNGSLRLPVAGGGKRDERAHAGDDRLRRESGVYDATAPLLPLFVDVVRVDLEAALVAGRDQRPVLAHGLDEQGNAAVLERDVLDPAHVVAGVVGVACRGGNANAGGLHRVEVPHPLVRGSRRHVERGVGGRVLVPFERDGVLAPIADGDGLFHVADLVLDVGRVSLPEGEDGLGGGQGIGGAEVVGVAHVVLGPVRHVFDLPLVGPEQGTTSRTSCSVPTW